ncbi:MAG TPA: hypothetical protein VFZ09_08490 [Archangium sp.]|uniref:hypothetical protein n=1 Tax=Archangium sp. TaxID=1872627 RepID=UPI002E33AA28|nr:hypothetical protein [Archangium sp.]HEX5746268.1 hypothetical protein [Archangium sp.]
MELLQWRVLERTPRGHQLRERLCAMTGALAPYPHGQRELARIVQEALARRGSRSQARSSEQVTRAEPTPLRTRGEEATEVLPGASVLAHEPRAAGARED